MTDTDTASCAIAPDDRLIVGSGPCQGGTQSLIRSGGRLICLKRDRFRAQRRYRVSGHSTVHPVMVMPGRRVLYRVDNLVDRDVAEARVWSPVGIGIIRKRGRLEGKVAPDYSADNPLW